MSRQQGYDRRSVWSPPPRPAWVREINEQCSVLDIGSVVPLDETSLLSTAQRNTGLDDFGEDGGRQHLRVLLDAIDREARLHFTGRVLTRSEFLLYLQARLGMVDWFKRHPEVLEQPVDDPIFIMGFGRSGTTILFELMSQDPQFRVVKKWESLFPCPPPEPDTYLTDPRIELTEKVSAFSENIIPEFKAMHKLGGNLPVESVEFMYPSFLSEVYPLAFQVPSYARYLADQGLKYTFGWHKKILQLLQSRYKAQRWLLKGPSHLPYLNDLLAVYPNARFVFTHRDPIVSSDSLVSFMGMIYWWRTDHPWGDGSIDEWAFAEDRARVWDTVIEALRTSAIPQHNVAQFYYHEFMADPMASIRGIYKGLGLTLSPEAERAMRDYLAARPQEKFGKHQYESSPAAVIAEERRVYQRYQQYFDVPNEI
jgi:hypothetical protein